MIDLVPITMATRELARSGWPLQDAANAAVAVARQAERELGADRIVLLAEARLIGSGADRRALPALARADVSRHTSCGGQQRDWPANERCTVPTCGRPRRRRGLCTRCRQYARKGKDPARRDAIRRYMLPAMSPHEAAKRAGAARGIARLASRSIAGGVRPPRRKRKCRVPGCDRRAASRGVCNACLMYARAGKDVERRGLIQQHMLPAMPRSERSRIAGQIAAAKWRQALAEVPT